MQRWRKKYKVVPRRRTNKKRKKLADRIPRWQRYHHRQVKLRKMGPALERGEILPDAKYGRWAPRYTFSLDQVPCPFAIGLGKTMEDKGASFVHISQPADGLEKRQATLQLIFRPTDQEAIPPECLEPGKETKALRRAVSQPKGCIIFRGLGKRLSALEKSMWDPRVIVLFQPKAWVDRPTAIKHVEALESWFKDEIPESKRGLLVVDNLDAQIQESYYQAVRDKWRCDTDHPPTGETDGVQAVDAGYGRDVKFEMEVECESWLDIGDNLEKWEEGKIKAWERRVLMTKWFADALDKVHKKYFALWRYHEKTGSIMTIDGTRHERICPGDIKEYVMGPRPLALSPYTASDIVLDGGDGRDDSSDEDEPTKDAEPVDEDTEDAPIDDNEEMAQDAIGILANDGDADDIEVEEESAPTLEEAMEQNGFEEDDKPDDVAVDTLMRRWIAFDWGSDSVGFSVGQVRKGASYRDRAKGLNFYVQHIDDELEQKHALVLSTYGASHGKGGWVLLKKSEET